MIKNEREYRITTAQANKFEQALSQLDTPQAPGGLHPLIQRAQRDALQSQLDELREQIAEYESLKSGQQAVISLNSLEELPRALIRARIAAGLTQRELAERMGLKEQQIQRYEATEYASADFARINEVARALGLRVREDIFLSNSRHPSAEQLMDLVQQTVAAYLKKVG
jgi:ribosome-binding protein aMBF1 (putative translation factor)